MFFYADKLIVADRTMHVGYTPVPALKQEKISSVYARQRNACKLLSRARPLQ